MSRQAPLTTDDRRILAQLVEKPLLPHEYGGSLRWMDKIKQKLRRRGLIEFDGTWRITNAGRAELEREQ